MATTTDRQRKLFEQLREGARPIDQGNKSPDIWGDAYSFLQSPKTTDLEKRMTRNSD